MFRITGICDKEQKITKNDNAKQLTYWVGQYQTYQLVELVGCKSAKSSRGICPMAHISAQETIMRYSETY